MKRNILIIVALVLVIVIGSIGIYSFTKEEEGDEKVDQDIINNLQNKTGKRVFNFETKTVILNSGYEMPLNGIGTYSLTGETCYNSIMSALESGVR